MRNRSERREQDLMSLPRIQRGHRQELHTLVLAQPKRRRLDCGLAPPNAATAGSAEAATPRRRAHGRTRLHYDDPLTRQPYLASIGRVAALVTMTCAAPASARRSLASRRLAVSRSMLTSAASGSSTSATMEAQRFAFDHLGHCAEGETINDHDGVIGNDGHHP